MKVLLLGATGAVGSEALRLALADAAIELVAPTRRALPPAPHLVNPVDPAGEWPDAPWQADAVLCTLGTTIAKAGSPAAFTAVDHDLVLRRTHAAGTPTAVLVSSLGASARGNFYLRTKHAVEEAAAAIGFRSLTILRPSMIDTERSESRPAERIGLLAMRGLAALIPRRYRAVPVTRIAEAMLAAARSAKPGRHVIESEAVT